MSPASGLPPPLGLSRRLLPSPSSTGLPYPPPRRDVQKKASMTSCPLQRPPDRPRPTTHSRIISLRTFVCEPAELSLAARSRRRSRRPPFTSFVSSESFRCLPEEVIQTRVAGPIIEPDKPGSDDSDRPAFTPSMMACLAHIGWACMSLVGQLGMAV
jgi:hypothetical protein